MPSPGELHTGREEDKEPDHSTAGVPVLRAWLLWLHTSSGTCSSSYQQELMCPPWLPCHNMHYATCTMQHALCNMHYDIVFLLLSLAAFHSDHIATSASMSETPTVFCMSHAVHRYASSTWLHRACHQQEWDRDYHYWGRLLSGISASGQLGIILEPGAGASLSTFSRLKSIIIPLIMPSYKYQQFLHLLVCPTL